MRRRRFYFAIGASAALLVGCQLLVPGDLPDFKCASADPSACPSGMTCDTSVGRCVSSAITPEEAGEEDADITPDVDAKSDADAPAGPKPIGSECVTNADCQSAICGTSTILTPAIVATASKQLCTQTCCTSGDCPTSFVCFGAGTGGNYCVPAARAQRATGGTKTPGMACGNNDECRSGLCDSGRCLDTCCNAAECAAGTTCRVKGVSVPPPVREVWACAAPEVGATRTSGETCSTAPKCANDNCSGIPQKCRPSCCNNSACTGMGAGAFCAYGTFITTNSYAKWCLDMNAAGSTPVGGSCNGDIDCQTRLCEPELADPQKKKCFAPCCRDIDCGGNLVCRPSSGSPPRLRCVDAR